MVKSHRPFRAPRLATAAALALLLTTSPAQANLLLNGSFELGNFTPNAEGVQRIGPSSPIQGWSTFVGDVYWVGPGNAFGISASEGGMSMSLYDPHRPLVRVGSVNQTVPTTPGLEYQLSFDIGTAAGFPRDVGVRVFAAGQWADFFSAGSGGAMDWERFSWRFTAKDTTAALQIMGLLGPSYPAYGLPGYIGLDNVVLEPVTPVPEPGPALLWLTGLATMLLGRSKLWRPRES